MSVSQRQDENLSIAEFYQKFYGSADKIAMEALDEIEAVAEQVGIRFTGDCLYRQQSTGSQLQYTEKKYHGKCIVYANLRSFRGVDYYLLTFMTHKHGGITVTFNTYDCLKEKYEEYRRKHGCMVNNRPPDKKQENTPEYLTKRSEDQQQKKKQWQEQRAKREMAAANRAADLKLFNSLSPADANNQYLVKKQLGAMAVAADLRVGYDQGGQFLAYQLQNIYGEFQGIQKIYLERKLFTKGMTKKGAFSVLGKLSSFSKVFVVTGLADALTVSHALDGKHAVVNALDDNNILPVLMAIRKQYTRVQLIVICDNDCYKEETGNSGIKHGINACLIANAKYVVPNFGGMADKNQLLERRPTDINDFYCTFGRDTTIKLLAKAKKIQKAPYAAELINMRYGGIANLEKNTNLAIEKLMGQSPIELSVKDVIKKLFKWLPKTFKKDCPTEFKRWETETIEMVNITAIAKAKLSKRFKTIDEEANNVIYKKVNSFAEIKQQMLKNGGIYILQAPKGYGKTKFKGEIITELDKNDRPVYICGRESLTRQAGERLKMENYQDTDKQAGCFFDSLAICVNSIKQPRFSDITECCDVLLLDEISQTLRHCATGSVDAPEVVLEHLKNCIANAPLVICGDADANDEVVKLLRTASPEEEIFVVKAGEKKLDKKIYFTKYSAVVIEQIMNAVGQNLKIMVMSDSRNQVSELALQIKKKFPKKKVLQVHAKTKSGDAKAFTEDPDKIIEKYDVVICSPAVSTGLSIETAYFDKHFGIFGGRSIIPQDALQMISRDRTANSFVISLNPTINYDVDDYTTILREKEAGFKKNVSLMQNSTIDTSHLYDDKHRYFDQLHARIKSEENMQRKEFANNFLLLAEDEGYKLIRMKDEPNKQVKKMMRKSKQEYLQGHILELKAQQHITDEEAAAIERSYINSYEEMMQLERHIIEKALGIRELAEDDIAYALDGGKRYVRNLVNFLLDDETLQAKDEAMIKQGVSISRQSNCLVRKKICALIFNTLGIDKTTGKGTYGLQQAQELVKQLIKIKDEFNSCNFGVRLTTMPGYPVKFANNLLKAIFGFVIENKHPMVNGIRAGRVYWINEDSFYQVMHYAANRLKEVHTTSVNNKYNSPSVQNSRGIARSPVDNSENMAINLQNDRIREPIHDDDS